MQPTDIGAHIKTERGIPPITAAAGTVDGPAIDRAAANGKLFLSAQLHAATGAVTGTPDSFTVNAKLQDSPDGTNDWQDITGAAITAITAADSQARKNVDLSGSRRYVRVRHVTAFVNGTSPKVGVSADVVLGGSDQLPAS